MHNAGIPTPLPLGAGLEAIGPGALRRLLVVLMLVLHLGLGAHGVGGHRRRAKAGFGLGDKCRVLNSNMLSTISTQSRMNGF